MSWLSVEIEVDGSTLSGWAKSNSQNKFAVAFSCGLEVGGHFKAAGKSYIAETVTDVSGRGEQLLIGGKEVKHDKPKSRGNAHNAGRKNLELKGDNGRAGED